jgi:hypothetical protein
MQANNFEERFEMIKKMANPEQSTSNVTPPRTEALDTSEEEEMTQINLGPQEGVMQQEDAVKVVRILEAYLEEVGKKFKGSPENEFLPGAAPIQAQWIPKPIKRLERSVLKKQEGHELLHDFSVDMSADQQESPLIGSRAYSYEAGGNNFLGQGGGGSVFKGRDIVNRKDIALKAEKPPEGNDLIEWQQTLIEGVALANKLHAKGYPVCEIKDAFQSSQTGFYLVMSNLEQLKRKRDRKIGSLLCETLLTLPQIHGKEKVCHRDIKLANLLYNAEEKRVEIIDFGLTIALKGEEEVYSLNTENKEVPSIEKRVYGYSPSSSSCKIWGADQLSEIDWMQHDLVGGLIALCEYKDLTVSTGAETPKKNREILIAALRQKADEASKKIADLLQKNINGNDFKEEAWKDAMETAKRQWFGSNK